MYSVFLGRLADLLETGGVEVRRVFRNLRFMVLDEADRLLQAQFEEQVEYVKSRMPYNRQTLFFSATIADLKAIKIKMIDFTSRVDEVNLVHKFLDCNFSKVLVEHSINVRYSHLCTTIKIKLVQEL